MQIRTEMQQLDAVLLAFAIVISGCGTSNTTPEVAGDTEEDSSAVAVDNETGGESEDDSSSASLVAEGEDGEEGPFRLGDLLDEFTPPTLAELDAQKTWIDRPVLDGVDLLRKRQQGEKVLGTVEEALSIRNSTPADNALICSAMGRLPISDDDIDHGRTFVRHTSGELKSTNPLMVSAAIEMDVASLTSFGLFSFDWNFTPFATSDTVMSWQSSDDRLADKVILRDDLVWSDGTRITAHDVAFSFQVIMSSRVPVPAVRSGTDQLKAVVAYDPQTLVYYHKEPLATNDWNVNFPVIPRHVYQDSINEDPKLQVSDYHVQHENNPVAGGPYEIVKRSRGQEVLLKAREDYYMHNGQQVRDRPNFDHIRFRVITEPSVALLAMKRGDIDEMVLTPEQWTGQTDGDDFYQRNTKAFGLEWIYYYIGWNCKTPYFSDKRVRQAMSYAFDHKEMLTTLLYDLYQPCNGVFHETSRWAPPDAAPPYQQDLDRAEELLDAAGWIDEDFDGVREKMIDGRKVPFRFTILVMNRPDRVDLCNLLKESLDQIGVICDVRPIEFTVLMEKNRTHDFDAMMGGWSTGADPDTSENLWKSDADRNYVQYQNPEVDQLFEEGKRVFDIEERAKVYQRIHQILYEDQPYTWLYFRNAYYGFNKELRGYVFSPRGPYGYSPGIGSLWKPAIR